MGPKLRIMASVMVQQYSLKMKLASDKTWSRWWSVGMSSIDSGTMKGSGDGRALENSGMLIS